jgi:penicillin amidase
VDPADLPTVLDPADGFVVAADQQVGGAASLTGDWDYGYRAQRIRDLLGQAVEHGPVEVADMQRIALDKYSPAAGVLVDALLAVDLDDATSTHGWADDGQELLRTWDRQMDADSSAAMYFAAVWRIVLAQTFSDELPSTADLTGDSRSVELVRQIVDDPQSLWWDDLATQGVVENRDVVLAQALVTARTELTAELGSDPDAWRWGTLHRIEPVHPVLGDASWAVRRLVNGGSKAVGGSSVSLDATTWRSASADDEPVSLRDGSTRAVSTQDHYTVVTAPSMRLVVDLADLDASTWVNLPGTSGHPAGSHYDDQIDAWADGKYYPWPYSAAAVRAAADTTLRLFP